MSESKVRYPFSHHYLCKDLGKAKCIIQNLRKKKIDSVCTAREGYICISRHFQVTDVEKGILSRKMPIIYTFEQYKAPFPTNYIYLE